MLPQSAANSSFLDPLFTKLTFGMQSKENK